MYFSKWRLKTNHLYLKILTSGRKIMRDHHVHESALCRRVRIFIIYFLINWGLNDILLLCFWTFDILQILREKKSLNDIFQVHLTLNILQSTCHIPWNCMKAWCKCNFCGHISSTFISFFCSVYDNLSKFNSDLFLKLSFFCSIDENLNNPLKSQICFYCNFFLI